MDKIVCFAGHRNKYYCQGIEEKLKKIIIDLINKGYDTFYDGRKGYFDNLCSSIVYSLKKEFPHIKLIEVLTNYKYKKDNSFVSNYYDGSEYPMLEEVFYLNKITKRNEWMVEHCNILVCHIEKTEDSGAFRMVKHAKKINKPIIFV